MPFTIPDKAEAPASLAQARLYQTDLDALVAGIAGDGVVDGCAVAAQAPTAAAVTVAAGQVQISGATVAVAGGVVAMPSADPISPRWVLVVADDEGAVSAVGGTAGPIPLLPTIPAGGVALAAVWWPATATAVSAAQITDKRVVVRPGVSAAALDAEAAARDAGDAALDARIDALEAAPPAHIHPISQVTGLQTALNDEAAARIAGDTALDGRLDALEAVDNATQAELDAHIAAADPHPGYQRESEKGVASGYASLASDGIHPGAEMGTGFGSIPAGKEAFAFVNALRQWVVRDILRLPEQAARPTATADQAVLYGYDLNGFTVIEAVDPSGFVYRLGGDSVRVVRNVTGATIPKGKVVYINGSFTGGGVVPTVALARANSVTTLPAVGVTGMAIPNNSYGIVVTEGRVDDIDTATSGAVDGQRVLVSAATAGEFTATVPALPNHTQRLGIVIKSHATTGSILVDPQSVVTGAQGTVNNSFSIGDGTAGTKIARWLAAFAGDLQWNPTAARTLTLPDRSGNVALELPEGRISLAGTPYYTLPGVEIAGGSTRTIANNRIYYAPILVTTPITLDQLALEVTTAGSAGGLARMGIYTATSAWQPDARVVDAGEVAVDSLGVKAATINVSLSPGRYLLALNSNAIPTLRVWRGGSRYLGLLPALGSSAHVGTYYVAQTYGAFPSTGVAADTTSSSTAAFDHMVFCRVSTP